MLGAWTDSALYGSEAELLDYDSDSDLKGYDKHSIFSQKGTFLALLPGDMLESTGDVPISMMDWKARSGKRVFHATFAAEAQAAGDTIGIAHYFRAYWCDIYIYIYYMDMLIGLTLRSLGKII